MGFNLGGVIMKNDLRWYFVGLAIVLSVFSRVEAQGDPNDPSRLTLERIFDSNEFRAESIEGLTWLEDGSGFTYLRDVNDPNNAQEIVFYGPIVEKEKVWVSACQLIPEGKTESLPIEKYTWSHDYERLLIFTNAKQVWRTKTRGDYWVLDRDSGKLQKIGGQAETARLMFAKFCPDGKQVAYVYRNNIYVQDLAKGRIRQLTRDGSATIVNGTSDWVNEEELRIRDGFRWSPDGRYIAYWQFDTSDVNSMTLINNTAALYPQTTSFPYPKAGQTNSICRVGVVSVKGGKTRWLKLPGDPREHYVPALDWKEDANELVIQQLNRLQNTHIVFTAQVKSRPFNQVSVTVPHAVFTDKDTTWVDPDTRPHWLADGRHFLWLSERDGWQHLYRVDTHTQEARVLSPGPYDIIDIVQVDETNNRIFFIASPKNPGQRYLFRLPLSGGPAERVTPQALPGSHTYNAARKGDWAVHTYSTLERPPQIELIRLSTHKAVRVLEDNETLYESYRALNLAPVEFFRVPIGDDIELDGWIMKPPDFDARQRYPVLFYVYGEPAGQTVRDRWPSRSSGLWHRLLTQQGFIVISMDNRGTPAPRGRLWRKSVYRQIGIQASSDQSTAVKQLLRSRTYLDPQRVGVWGWSGGGSMTLNAMFRYPDLYQVGIAVAFVSDMRYYDTIYQERYMGLPSDNEDGYRDGSPITFAEQLKGDLLLVYGTGDDNCHYQNCEALINKLVEHNKPFDLMVYPNRRHRIAAGKNTSLHLYTLMTRYLTTRMRDR